jgi:hypothetical protein
MATLISPSLAITARHVLPSLEETTGGPDLALSFSEAPTPLTVRATVVAHNSAIDLAVLELESAVPPASPHRWLSDVRPAPGSAWETLFLRPGDPSQQRVHGTVGEGFYLPASLERLRLHPAGPVPSPGGTSGAPVMVDGAVVGIIVGRETDGEGWLAVPVTSMVRRFRDLVTPAIAPRSSENAPESGATVKQAGIRQDPDPQDDTDALFQGLAPSGTRAVEYAVGLQTALGRNVVHEGKLHMEHLIAGLFDAENSLTRRLLENAGITRRALSDQLSAHLGGPLPARGYARGSLVPPPACSGHVRQALAAAAQVANERQSQRVGAQHLIYGALSVDTCSVIERLVAAGVRRENIDLGEPAPASRGALPIAEVSSDDPYGTNLLNIDRDVEALCAVLAARRVSAPLALGLFGDWGGGKSFFMDQMEKRIKELTQTAGSPGAESPYSANIVQIKFNAWHYIERELWASLASEIFEGLSQAIAEEAARRDAQQKGAALDPEQERARLQEHAALARAEEAEARREKAAADEELRQSEERLRQIERAAVYPETRRKARSTLRAAGAVLLQQPEVQQNVQDVRKRIDGTVQEVARELNLPEDEVRQQLVDLQGIGGEFRKLRLALRGASPGARWQIGFGVLLVLLVLGGLTLYGPTLLAQLGALQKFLAYLIGSLPGVLLVLRSLVPALRRVLEIANKVQAETDTLNEEERQRALRGPLQEYAASQQKVADVQQRLDQAGAKVLELERQIEDLRANRQMNQFIQQIQTSTDFAQHLTVIARAHRHFEQLSVFMTKVRRDSAAERARATTTGMPYVPGIDRIILYVDDLDRCPEKRVMEVLQAVHLLLAFPLFVVVVAVDPRWLLHSLKQSSPVFDDGSSEEEGVSAEERAHWRATPLNYLEKIFQIPFTLRPMDRDGFNKLIEHHASPRQEGSAGAEVTHATSGRPPVAASEPAKEEGVSHGPGLSQDPDQAPDDPRQDPSPDAGGGSPGSEPPDGATARPPTLTQEHLQIEAWEREFMKQLYSLIPTPRAAKRFVNVYRLIRAWAAADPEQLKRLRGDKSEGEYRAVLLLLALQTGYPDEATQILQRLVREKPDGTWWEFVDSFPSRPRSPSASVNGNGHASAEALEGDAHDSLESIGAGEQPADMAGEDRWPELLTKLDAMRSLIPERQSCTPFSEWAYEVARYSFQSGRILLAREEEGVEVGSV